MRSGPQYNGLMTKTLFSVLALSFARVCYTNNLPSSLDIGVTASAILVWQEIELTYSLAATTLMTLRPFTKDFNTGLGMGGDAVGEYGNTGDGSGRGTSRGRYGNRRLSRAQQKHSELLSETNFELDQRTNRHGYHKRKAEKPKAVIVQENYLGKQDACWSPLQSPTEEHESRLNTTTIIYASPASTTAGHSRRRMSGSRGSAGTSPDEITVTQSVEQKVSPRNMV